MKTLVKLAVTLLAGATIANANAGIISGPQQYVNDFGQNTNVALQGLEWLSLDHSFGIARTAIDNQAWRDNQGTQWQANEWRYATREETNNLLNSLWGNTFNGWGFNNYQGASWFEDNFGLIAGSNHSLFTDYQRAFFYYGEQDACTDNDNFSCVGAVALGSDTGDNASLRGSNSTNVNAFGFNVKQGNASGLVYDPVNQSGAGFIRQDFGADFGLTSPIQVANINTGSASRASFLVRNTAEVPEPAPITLMALSLVGLAFLRKRKVK